MVQTAVLMCFCLATQSLGRKVSEQNSGSKEGRRSGQPIRTPAIPEIKAPASKAVRSCMDGAKSKANYCPEKQKRRFQVLLKGTQMGGGGGPDYIVSTQSNGNSLHFKCQDKVLVFWLPVGILRPAMV